MAHLHRSCLTGFAGFFCLVLLCVFVSASCGKKDGDGDKATQGEAVSTENEKPSGAGNNENGEDNANTQNKQYVYITADNSVALGQYKGIEFTPVDTTVTDAEISQSMNDTLKYFQTFMDVDELTDELVAEFYEDYDSVGELYNALKEIISQRKQTEAKQKQQEEILNKIVENSDILVDMTDEAAECYSSLMIHYNVLAVASDKTLDDYMLETVYPNASDWKEKLAADAATLTCRHAVLLAIAEAEGMSVSDSEYEEAISGYMEYYGYDNRELFEQEFSKDQITKNILEDKALSYVVEKAVPVSDNI